MVKVICPSAPPSPTGILPSKACRTIPSTRRRRLPNAVLATTGARTNKHKDAHQKLIAIEKQTYRGSATAWRLAMGMHEDWLVHPAPPLVREEIETQLRCILCPACSSSILTKGAENKQTPHFPHLRCRCCEEATSSQRWACPCGLLWYKCGQHVLQVTIATGRSATRKGNVSIVRWESTNRYLKLDAR